FAGVDPAYADRLLAAARRAHAAALAHPALYAPPAGGDDGGGAYDDDDLSDEFYWAAAELFLTTGEAGFLAAAKASPHWDGPVFVAPVFDWRSVAGFARLQLAAQHPRLEPADARAIVASV